MKKFIITLLLVCLVLSFASTICAAQLRFAFMPGIADPFYFTMEKGAKAKAEELGLVSRTCWDFSYLKEII